MDVSEKIAALKNLYTVQVCMPEVYTMFYGGWITSGSTKVNADVYMHNQFADVARPFLWVGEKCFWNSFNIVTA